jgi:hypothetical protein
MKSDNLLKSARVMVIDLSVVSIFFSHVFLKRPDKPVILILIHHMDDQPNNSSHDRRDVHNFIIEKKIKKRKKVISPYPPATPSTPHRTCHELKLDTLVFTCRLEERSFFYYDVARFVW